MNLEKLRNNNAMEDKIWTFNLPFRQDFKPSVVINSTHEQLLV